MLARPASDQARSGRYLPSKTAVNKNPPRTRSKRHFPQSCAVFFTQSYCSLEECRITSGLVGQEMALRFFTTMEEGECIGLLATLEPMREAEGGQQAVSVEEVVLAQAFEFNALANILKNRRVIRLGEVVAEIKRLKEKGGR